MSDQATPNPGDTGTPPAPRKRGRGRTVTIAAVLALAAGLTGAFVNEAFSRGPFGDYGFMGERHGQLDPAEMAERADKGIRHLAIEINATAEQQEKLRAIVKSAITDLAPLRDQGRQARERGLALLTGPNVDRTAIETFRAEQIAKAEAASKRLTQALADAAEVLSPEQRQQIAAFIERHRGPGMSFRGIGPGLWHGPRGG